LTCGQDMGWQRGRGQRKDPITLGLMYVAFPCMSIVVDFRSSTHDFMDTRQQLYCFSKDILVGNILRNFVI
jgi:hypothetical protein